MRVKYAEVNEEKTTELLAELLAFFCQSFLLSFFASERSLHLLSAALLKAGKTLLRGGTLTVIEIKSLRDRPSTAETNLLS